MAALVVGHPAEEQDIGPVVVASPVTDGELAGLHPVVDDPGHGDLGAARCWAWEMAMSGTRSAVTR